MFDLVVLQPAVEAVQHLSASSDVVHHVSSSVQAEGILDTINDKATQATSVFKVVASLVLIVFVLLYTVRGGFSLGRLISAGMVAGLCAWLIWGGVLTVRDKTKEDLDSAPAHVQIYDSSHQSVL